MFQPVRPHLSYEDVATDAEDNLDDDVEAVAKAAWADIEDDPEDVCGACGEQEVSLVDEHLCGPQCADDAKDAKGAREAKGLPDAKAPTEAEELRQMLTHLQ